MTSYNTVPSSATGITGGGIDTTVRTMTSTDRAVAEAFPPLLLVAACEFCCWEKPLGEDDEESERGVSGALADGGAFVPSVVPPVAEL